RRALGRVTRREAVLTHALHAPVILMLGLSFIAVVAFFDTGVFSGDAGLVVYVIGFWDVLAWLIVTFLAVVVTSLTCGAHGSYLLGPVGAQFDVAPGVHPW